MAIPTFTMRQLLEAGVHFGHQTKRWDPRMKQYIFGERNGVHIIDLQQTVPLLHTALKTVRDVVSNGGRVLLVGTKRQASVAVAEVAKQCGQYYVNHRWLGGMMTNFKTISQSISRLRALEANLEGDVTGFTKKELLNNRRSLKKLESALGGIKDMGGLPDIIIVIDTNKESIAVKEANKIGIPVVAILDSNVNPNGVQYPVPGNDDALRSINLYLDLFGKAIIDGLQADIESQAVELQASDEVLLETFEENAPAPEDESVSAPEESSDKGQGGETNSEESSEQVA